MNFIFKLEPNKHCVEYKGVFWGIRFYFEYNKPDLKLHPEDEDKWTPFWEDEFWHWLENSEETA